MRTARRVALATRRRSGAVVPATGQSPAGPPPMIPAELPATPAGAVNIDNVKAKDKVEEKKGFELSDLAPENVYKSLKKSAGYGPDEKIARAGHARGQGVV